MTLQATDVHKRLGSTQALAGATLLVNLSASNEVIGKPGYRRNLVASQSGRCAAGYAYVSAGPTESTTDLVFSGHCLIAENGALLAESEVPWDKFAYPEIEAAMRQFYRDHATQNYGVYMGQVSGGSHQILKVTQK